MCKLPLYRLCTKLTIIKLLHVFASRPVPLNCKNSSLMVRPGLTVIDQMHVDCGLILLYAFNLRNVGDNIPVEDVKLPPQPENQIS